MKKKLLFQTISFSIGLIAFSCNTGLDEDINNRDSNILSEICVKNGYLVFNSLSTFKETEEKLSKFSNDEINTWESSFDGFTSQRAIYELASELDYQFALEKEANHPGGFPENQRATTQIYADYVLENKDLFEFPEDAAFRLKIEGNRGAIERFVNRDGLVQIGDSIFRFVDQKIMIILNGDERKRYAVIENQQDSSVIIMDVVKISIKGTNYDQREVFFGNESCENRTSGGGQRVVGRTRIVLNTTTDMYNVYGFGFYARVVTYTGANFRADNEAHSWGAWRGKDTAQLKITGTNIVIDFGGVGTNINSFTVTNPSQVKYISWDAFGVYQAYRESDIYNTSYLFAGSARFYGRDGTMCSL